MGAQIKVELSLARAPSSSKGGSEPPTPYPDHAATPMPPIIGAPNGGVNNSGCFVCGSHDHWARECPDSDKMPQRNPPGSDRPSDARKPMWINGCVSKQSLISVSRQCSSSSSSLLEHPRFVILTLFSLFVLLPVNSFHPYFFITLFTDLPPGSCCFFDGSRFSFAGEATVQSDLFSLIVVLTVRKVDLVVLLP